MFIQPASQTRARSSSALPHVSHRGAERLSVRLDQPGARDHRRVAAPLQRNSTARCAGKPAASALPRATARDGEFHFRTVYLTGKLTFLPPSTCTKHARGRFNEARQSSSKPRPWRTTQGAFVVWAGRPWAARRWAVQEKGEGLGATGCCRPEGLCPSSCANWRSWFEG